MNPFTISVTDKAFGQRETIGNPTQLTVVPRHMQQPTASLVVPFTHAAVPLLMTAGARVEIDYMGQHLVGGIVSSIQGDGLKATSTLTVQVSDDYRLVTRMLAWPVPTGTVTSGSVSGQTVEYRTLTGPAETVLKSVIVENATRLGLPVTVLASMGRGATITATFRFHPIADRVIGLADAAGVGLTVVRSGSGFVVDCYTPRVYPTVLTETSRVVRDWSWNRSSPSATRVIVGGQGNGVARTFRRVIGTTLESTWGDVVEVFTDANDLTTSADLDARAAQTLVDNAPAAGLSVSLAENGDFRYDPSGAGASVRVGDLISMEVGPGIVVTDVLREATLSYSAGGGLKVTPTVGDSQSTDDQIFRALSNQAAAIRDQKAGR